MKVRWLVSLFLCGALLLWGRSVVVADPVAGWWNAPGRFVSKVVSRTAQAPRTMSSYHAPAAPVLDGFLAEWDGVPMTILDRDTADYVADRIIPLPVDLSAAIRSMWTTDTVYLAFRVIDDVIVLDSMDVWHDDEIEIFASGPL